MFVYVGGYTSEDRQGRGMGITVFECKDASQPWHPVQTLKTDDNPSMLRISPNGRVLYAAHGARTRMSAYRIDAVNGRISPHGSQDCGGVNPVDLGFSHGGGFMVTANYTSGTVAVLPIGPDGTMSQPRQIVALTRPGPDADKPPASLPHGVTFDPSNQFVLIPDKGLDCVFVFRIGHDGHLAAAHHPFSECEAGAGPRHAAFHPHLPLLYVVNELSCSVQVFKWDGVAGELAPVQTMPALLEDHSAVSAGAEIAVAADGLSVYASIRGDNSIAFFQADPETGLLSSPKRIACGGKEPRFFTITPDHHALLVANQESDVIVAYTLDRAGMLHRGTIVAHAGSSSSICFGSSR